MFESKLNHLSYILGVDVADDVHGHVTDFVRGYLQQYPEVRKICFSVNNSLPLLKFFCFF